MLALWEVLKLPYAACEAALKVQWASSLLLTGGAKVVDGLKDAKIADQEWHESVGILPSRKELSAKKLKKMQEKALQQRRAGQKVEVPEKAPEEVLCKFEIPQEGLPEDMEIFTGEWVVTEEERDQLLFALKMEGLRSGRSPEAQHLMRMCHALQIPYEQMGFIWEGFDFDVENLRRLSERRRGDPRIQAMLEGKES